MDADLITGHGGDKSADRAASNSNTDSSSKLSEDSNDPNVYSFAFAIPKHRSITEEALSPYGVKGATALAELKGGNAAQDLDLTTRNDPAHHFDSNRIPQSLAYLDQNRREIDKMLLKPSLTLDDEANILNAFGHRLHTLQDFYAHSNYVEIQLKQNPSLLPKDIPLMNFNDLKSGKLDQIHTGYSVKDETTRISLKRPDIVRELLANGEKIPGTNYLPSEQYANLSSFQSRVNYFSDQRFSVLHRDINKDDSHSERGRVVNPRTGINLHEYARNLALRESSLEWSKFEARIKQLRGKEYGNEILYQMKTMHYDRRPSENNNF